MWPVENLKRPLSRDILIAILLGTLSLVILIYYLREPNFVDDSTYFEYAEKILQGNPGKPTIANSYRLGFIFIVALAQKIFGYTPAAYYVVSVGYSIGLISALYVLCRLLMPVVPSVAACLLVLTSPVFLEYATILRVDWPGLFWFVSGLSLFIYGLKASDRSGRRLAAAFLAALCFFMSLWTKEGIAPLFLGLPAILLVVKRDKTTWVALCLTLVVGLAAEGLELIVNAKFFGEPFARLSHIFGGHVSGAKSKWIQLRLIPGDLTFSDLIVRYPEQYARSLYGRFFLGASLLGLCIVFVGKDRNLLLFGTFSLVSWAFVSLMVTSLDPLIPLLRTKDRYFSIVFLNLMPLIAGVIWIMMGKISSLLWRQNTAGKLRVLGTAGVTGLLILVGLFEVNNKPYFIKNGANAVRQTRRIVKELLQDGEIPLNRILSGKRTLRAVRMYIPRESYELLRPLDYQKGKTFDFTSKEDFKPGDLVVLNLSRLINNQKYKMYDNTVPDFIFNPPFDWQLLAKTKWRKFRIYYVGNPVGIKLVTLSPVLFHGYSYHKTDKKVVTRKICEGKSVFSLDQAEDVRIVLGKGKYHKPPELKDNEQALAIYKKCRKFLSLTAKPSGTLDVVKSYAVIFNGKKDKPLMVPLRVETKQGELNLSGRIDVDPDQDDYAFRIMLKITGSGELVIKNVKEEIIYYDNL